jgi:hypothetical protein
MYINNMINWISTYNFLNYQPDQELELEIFNLAKENTTPFKIGNPISPNSPIPYNKKTFFYPLEFLQQNFQNEVK